MSSCIRGRELLLDLQRSDFLPAWDEEGVRFVINEMNSQLTAIDELSQRFPDGRYPGTVRVTLFYHHQCIERNRRYLDSYITHRLRKIRSVRWEVGALLPDNIRQDTLSSREADYFMSYSDLLSGYCESVGVDITSDLEPPKDLFIEIRVERSCGEVMFESGSVNLEKGTTHFLKRSDVEHLIRQGDVKHLRNDEL